MSQDDLYQPAPSENPFASPRTVDVLTVSPPVGSGYVSDLSAIDTFRKGWEVTAAGFGLLLGIVILHSIIRLPSDSLDNIALRMGIELPWWTGLIQMAYSIFVVGPISMSVAWVFLRAVRKERIDVADMFAVFHRNYLPAVGAGLLKAILIVIGFILLIVPGVYLACRLALVEYLIVDRRMGVIEALNESWTMTAGGRSWTILLMFVLAIPIYLVGLLALCVGVIVSVMWVSAAFAVLYYSFGLQDGTEPGTLYSSNSDRDD